MDFYKIVERRKKKETEIYPDFQVTNVKDLLVRGGSFYGVWNEKNGLWSTKELDVQGLVDEDLWRYAEELKNNQGYDGKIIVKNLASDSTGSWMRFKNYIKRFPDTDIRLDEKLTFANSEVKKKDYVSKRLPYALEDGDYSAWDELVSRLYDPSEREKIEWAIGAVVSGDSKKIQKFCVFYGEPGTGKGTIIDVIEKLFPGYYVTFDAKALGSSNNQFATEVFRTNPLVAIQHDGDLSRIEDNTKLNTIISHEVMVINEKNKPQYMGKANCFLFLGTNHPVRITDAKSGIIRRLIDIFPSGRTFPPKEYDSLMGQIDFQLGAIAYHCLEVYRELGKNYYKTYMPKQMIMKTDVFYNFVEANLDIFESEACKDGITLKQAYSLYKDYCDDALVEYKLPRHKFREELKNYFTKFEDVARVDGKLIRSWYSGFRKEKMEPPTLKREEKSLPLVMDSVTSLLDDILADCPAQYAKEDGSPELVWDDVKTTLKDIDTSKVHYVLPQKKDPNLVVVDFDLRNDKGEKDALKNAEAASKWKKTYSEFSKGGAGIHLTYIYDGDVNKLSPVFADGIEIKVFKGKAALRRRMSKCNDIPIAHLPVGALPIREEKMIDTTALKDEKHLRNLIKKSLRKDIHGATRPEIDMIAKALEEAYESGMVYDVSDMEPDIFVFAMNSTNQSDYCIAKVAEMKFESKDKIEEKVEVAKSYLNKINESDFVFYDIETFPNLLLLCWKQAGEGKSVQKIFNPKPVELEEFFRMPLIGFNDRKYDRHILFHRYLGNSVESCYDLSKRIITEHANDALYPEAYSIGYTDVYDFASEKKGLKKWEIELAKKWANEHPGEDNNPFRHFELGLPWDQPVDESLWDKVAEYCANDVICTEAVFNLRKADFTARQILADIAGGTVNDTTNQLSQKFIFGSDRNPQKEFNYRDMGDMSDVSDIYDAEIKRLGCDPEFTKFDTKGRPIFPGYKYDFGKSYYRGELVGEGGYVFAIPGIHVDIPTQDVSGMHPASAIAEELFGPRYTKRFAEIVQARIYIKHKEFDKAKTLLDGKLAKYLEDASQAKGLAAALKIVVNSVYGLTSAKFSNAFRDPRNKDNIVAKRGALFMVNLKHEVQRRGFKVVHIKTDSIKVERATEDLIDFIRDYGKLYGYSFETEAEYDRLCLVNDAVYIAYEKSEGWTATGAQFAQPYVFKTLFSGEPIEFDDYCETKNVTDGAIYLDLNEDLPDVSHEEKLLEKRLKQLGLNHESLIGALEDHSLDQETEEEIVGLRNDISVGHNYKFVGRTGLFCPIKPGRGGGWMMRQGNGKYNSVTGTKDYRWLEAEFVRQEHREEDVDPRYHDGLAAKAVEAINKFGSFEDFIDLSKPYISRSSVDEDRAPWDEDSVVPCGDGKFNSCMECPYCEDDICHKGYSLASYIERGAGK